MQEHKTNWQTLQASSALSQVDTLFELINEAEAVVIGVGAGMSAATGFTYVGKRFTDAFPDFIKKYNLFDMLQAFLYEYEDRQEYWAFQSRFSLMNYFDQAAGQAYIDLRHILDDKNYHIITTNGDNAFHAAEFDMNKVFRIQGEFGLLQCVDYCHQQTYQKEALMREMKQEQVDMKVPLALLPTCPKCGADMEINKRTEEKGMVEDADFHAQKGRYEQFLKENENKKVLYLEIGVGHTTPQFIKHPFQRMTMGNEKALFVTMNQKGYRIPASLRSRTVQIDEDIADVLHGVRKKK